MPKPPTRLESASPSPRALRVVSSVLELIGATPLLRLTSLEPEDGAEIWAKLELNNPTGSIKARPALAMLEAAERAGQLLPGSTIVEATSGNTGISLAMLAAVKRYRCVLVMPDDMSLDRRYLMAAYGAEIVLTSGVEGMSGAVSRAHDLVEETPGAFMPSQFNNPANPQSHFDSTGAELLEQLGGSLDAFVAGVGTGGTITGVGRLLRERLGAAVKLVAVEPATSAVLSGRPPGPHRLQGLGAGFVPPVLDRALLDEVMPVSDSAAERMARRLAREVGILAGPSSGANVVAAVEIARQLGRGKKVATVLCDTGERYVSGS